MLTVKYFASMRERMGKAEQQVALKEESISISQLWTYYLSDEPLPVNTLIALNMEYCDAETLVKAGDEVAFFPPVTGG